MLDKSIPHIRVIMVKSDTADYPRFELPEGFVFRGYEPGFENAWAELIFETEQAETLEKAREIFTKEFLESPEDLERRCLFVIEESSGRIAATASLWYGDLFGEVMQRIHWVATRPEYQGKGLVKALMTRLLDIYNELGCKGFIYLTSQTWSYKALNLYSRFGFRPYLGPKPVNWKYDDPGDFEKKNEEAWKLVEMKISGYEKAKTSGY